MASRISDAAYDRATRLVRKHLQTTHQAGEFTTAKQVGAVVFEGFSAIRDALKGGSIDTSHPLVNSKTPDGWTSWYTQTLLKAVKDAIETEGKDYTPAAFETLKEIHSLWGKVNGQGKGGGKGATSLGEFSEFDDEFPLD